jgi:hypothetical protein
MARTKAYLYCVAAGLLLSAAAFAAEKKAEEVKSPATCSKPDKDSAEKHSFWFIGSSNYHLRLKESEERINGMLNRPLGAVLPRWKHPITFKEWSEDFRIWDLWGGFGHDINDWLSWSIYAGGGAGTVPNQETYFPLGLPTTIKADFTRRSLLLGSSLSYYPFGRPEKEGKGLVSALAGTRPMAEMNIGYTHQTVVGDVKASVPVFGTLLHIEDKSQYHLFWASPRLGFEIPVTTSDSVNVLGGYLFFHQHSQEFNGGLLEVFVRHRF